MERITWADPRIGQPIAPIASEAWIDPLGKFYAVPDHGHCQWAEQEYGVGVSLEPKGWLHVSYGMVYHDRELRQAQLDTLYELLEAYKAAEYRHLPPFERTFNKLLGEVR